MNHEELMKKLDTVICNLNDDGLALMYYFIGDMHEIEKYNINTSSDRLEEIKLLEKRQDAKEEEVKQKRKLEEMEAEERKKKAAISSLTGKERKFWDKIEKVCKMDISRYTKVLLPVSGRKRPQVRTAMRSLYIILLMRG